MLAALASSQPEIRFVAARALEERQSAAQLMQFATELVGPPKPDRAAELKKWPEEDERNARLRVIVDALASDDPSLRYAAARVLSLRTQAQAFWRESARLKGPKADGEPTVPQTNWEDGEVPAPRRSGWIRRLIGGAVDLAKTVASTPPAAGNVRPIRTDSGESPAPALADIRRLVFGTYAGLVRQAPAAGASDETHRVRRDSIERLGKLGDSPEIGRDSVLPVLRRALSDPNHLVRRAAVAALRGLYPAGSVEPLGLALQSSASDVGRAAVDELVQLATAEGGTADARTMALEGVDAPNAEVRAHALLQIQKLFEPGSLEPWFVALGSQHADLRLSVVDRLVDARDERVGEALMRAMESDHEDLRLKAASALARRTDLRTVDVLAAFLRAEDQRVATRAVEALVSLAKLPAGAAAAAETIAARIEDDPDRTADRNALISALRRIADPKGAPVLLNFITGEEAALRAPAFDALIEIARDPAQAPQRLPNGTMRARYRESLLLGWLSQVIEGNDAALREKTARLLRDVDAVEAEPMLARLLEDREEAVRVAACEVLAFRAEHVPGATLEALENTLAVGRRELVLPAAEGLAMKGRSEAFKPLLLVFKAGADHERRRAILALGTLGDRRALEDLEPLLDPEAEITPEDRALAPAAVEALGAMLNRLTDQDERDRVRQTVERAALQGDHSVRLGALAGLARAADGRSRGLIEKIARERLEPEAIRVQAVQQLGELGPSAEGASSEEVLAELLSDNSANLRTAAHRSLERIFPSERTRTALLALRSRHAEISGPAASFLAKHGDAEVLVARMTEIADDSARQRLRRGLIRRGECPSSLAELLRGDAAPQRADAAWIAGACGAAAKPKLGDALREAVTRSATQWRERAGQTIQADAARAWRASLWAAGRVGADVGDAARSVVDGSAGGALEPPVEVSVEALRYLAAHGRASDLAMLEPALSHRNASVRTAAGAAVAKLAGAKVGEVVDRLSVADQVAVAPLIEAAIAAGQGEELLETAERRRLGLPSLLGDARFQVLIAVAEAAGPDPERGKRSEAQRREGSVDPARLTAIASLGRLGTEQATAVLQGLLDRDGENEAVRKVAFKALRRAQRGKTTTANRGAIQQ
jgi:ParB family chromosome partitioning protein